MKNIYFLLLVLLFTPKLFSQQPAKNDVILKMNGEELVGKVLKISDNDIEFAYAGETLVYNIKRADIMKITFSSGRIQVINKPSLPSESVPNATSNGGSSQGNNATSLEEHHNKVALLPISLINDGQPASDASADQIQNECFVMMNKHAGIYTIINPRTSNALLAKAGINKGNIRGYTMDDLCNILGVEYVVDCSISMNRTSQTVSQSNSGVLRNKNNNDKNFNSYSVGTSTQNYSTSVTFEIFNDKGTSVYNQNRQSFWNTQDAYKSTLEYLLKRSPLYTK